MDNVFIQHSIKVLQALNKQREAGRYCDATLVVGDLQFKAHWSILACSSPFFQSLYGDGRSPNIILHERFSEVMGLLLDFLYTGELTLSHHNVEKVLSASKELGVFEAVEVCERFQPKCFEPVDRTEDFFQQSGTLETLNGHLKEAEESDGEDTLKGISELGNVLADSEVPVAPANEQDSSLSLLQGTVEITPFQEVVLKDPEIVERREFKRQRRGQKNEPCIGSDGDCITVSLWRFPALQAMVHVMVGGHNPLGLFCNDHLKLMQAIECQEHTPPFLATWATDIFIQLWKQSGRCTNCGIVLVTQFHP